MATATQQRYLHVKADPSGQLVESNVESVVTELFNMLNLLEQRVITLEAVVSSNVSTIADHEARITALEP
jgi:hypothetical protein